MNLRTALIPSALLLAVLGWACEQQGPTSPSALGAPGGGSLGGVSLGTATGVILGVRKDCEANPDDPRCEPKAGGGVVFEVDVVADLCDGGSNTLLRVGALGLTSETSLFTKWQTYGLTVSIPSIGTLNGRAEATVSVHKGEIGFVTLYLGGGGNRYATGALTPVTIDGPLSGPFTIHLDDDVEVFPYRTPRAKKQPSVGTICIGDLVFTPTS